MKMKTYMVDFVGSEIKEVSPDTFAPYHITITPMKLREGRDMTTTKKVATEAAPDPRDERIRGLIQELRDVREDLDEVRARRTIDSQELEAVKKQLARACARADYGEAMLRSAANVVYAAAENYKNCFPAEQKKVVDLMPQSPQAWKWSGEIDPARGEVRGEWALAK